MPKTIVYCDDKSVIGTEFYLTEFVEGRIFLNPNLPELNPEERREIYEEIVSTLAKLH